MTRVSCISPSYNTSKYLDGFLESVAQQTHSDLEVVLDHNDPTKEEVAKCSNLWNLLPHIVSKGGQYSFLIFMENKVLTDNNL